MTPAMSFNMWAVIRQLRKLLFVIIGGELMNATQRHFLN